jgi:hypothetical protein
VRKRGTNQEPRYSSADQEDDQRKFSNPDTDGTDSSREASKTVKTCRGAARQADD